MAEKWSISPGGGTPSTSAVGDAASAGTDPREARGDHVHGREGFATPVATGAANAQGSATTIPRSDHVHATGTPAFVSFDKWSVT